MLKKSILILLILIGSSTPALAQYKSYFDYMDRWNTAQKIGFSERMIVIYERSNQTYKNIIDRYKGKFGHHSWFLNLEQRYAWQLNEIDRYKKFLETATTDKTVLKTTQSHLDGQRKFNSGQPSISEVVTENEERSGELVRVYAVTKTTTVQPYTIHHWRHTTTTKWWSDGTQSSTSETKIVKIEHGEDVSTSSNRELVREYYQVAQMPGEGSDFLGVKTPGTLTEEEYLKRADVSLGGTQNYIDAVHNGNPRVNLDFITRQSGMYKLGGNMAAIGAPTAWSRGWTGKGSRIAIMDTGIDVDHPEFSGKIVGIDCFTAICDEGAGSNRQTVDDKSRMSHGTHVASVAAASLDGTGMTGVAPDAELLIGKIAWDRGFYDFTSGGKALSWAVNNGAVVANFSGGIRVTSTYVADLERVDEGLFVYRGDIESYKKYGYGAYLKRNDWPSGVTPIIDAMKGNEVVVVMSAGNDAKEISNVATHIALDEEIGDRVLVVGSLDLRDFEPATHSNLAGTVCVDWNYDTEVCENDRRISDRYLLAPGQWVMGAADDGRYNVLSGTSMAAPHVSGAVAVIHQMWPHMKGENIAQLLLDTGNKSVVPNYSEARHGQGALDLAEATKPQGGLGIPVSGRASGAALSLNSIEPIQLNKELSALSSVMAVDGYERDFYFNANTQSAVDTRSVSPTVQAMQGTLPDYYFSHSRGVPIAFDDTQISLSDVGGISLSHSLDGGLKIGLLSEPNSFLGNVANSQIMKVDGATTAYMGYEFDYGNVFGSAKFGATQLNVDPQSFLKSAGTVLSHSGTLGVKFSTGNSTFGLVASVPVTIQSGDLTFEMPSSLAADGSVIKSTFSESLATHHEVDYGIFLNSKLGEDSTLNAYAELRENYAGSRESTFEIGVSLAHHF